MRTVDAFEWGSRIWRFLLLEDGEGGDEAAVRVHTEVCTKGLEHAKKRFRITALQHRPCSTNLSWGLLRGFGPIFRCMV